jgi:hypothetical protein
MKGAQAGLGWGCAFDVDAAGTGSARMITRRKRHRRPSDRWVP